MPRSLVVESLVIRGFRNLASVDVELGHGFNVLSGDNGQGKTNLIEAVYVLATSRSFRTSKLTELVTTGGDAAGIRGRVREDDASREQSVVVRAGLRSARIDGKRPPTLATYALRTPTVVFHPGAMALTAGGGAERRRLLDRIALYQSAAALVDVEGYAKAMRSRQRVLEARGEMARDLDGWEELAAVHGLAVSAARASAAGVLIPAARHAFSRIGQGDWELDARYARSAPQTVEAFRSELVRRRSQDRARRSATTGPHRDDLVLALGGRPVRGMASQGQHRSTVLALKLAEIEVVAATRGLRPVLLLDDVSSELDRERTAALFTALRDDPSQVLLTTTRPELLDMGALSGVDTRRDFVVVGGRIMAS